MPPSRNVLSSQVQEVLRPPCGCPTTRLLLAFGDLVDVLVLLLLARLLYVLLLLNNPVQEGPKEVGGNDHHCCLDVDEQVTD